MIEIQNEIAGKFADTCVLIPYFEAGEGLLNSLSSIREEILPFVCVVDDGSTEKRAETVLSGYNGPLFVHLICMTKNSGIEVALNTGLDFCIPRFKYIARLDCWDLSIPFRLEYQRAFLVAHPDIVLVGGWAEMTDFNKNKLFTLRHPTESSIIKKRMFLNSQFTHPAIMFRGSVFEHSGRYPTTYPAAEDLALYFKIIKLFETANLPFPVVSCVIDPRGISTVKRKHQLKSRIRLILKNFDGSSWAFIGLFRAVITYFLPRSVTVYINIYRNRFRLLVHPDNKL
ncbi:hypothetical protein CDEF62S_05354 [Castellaniella defragrans]